MNEITFCLWCFAEVKTENLDRHERWHDQLNIKILGK